jgi:hypothetical protein
VRSFADPAPPKPGTFDDFHGACGNVVSIISLVLYAWLLSTVDGAKPAIRGAEAF